MRKLYMSVMGLSGAIGLLGLVLLTGLTVGVGPRATAQTAERYFYETNHWVRGRFLYYWNTHGGLAQQGYPISDEFAEESTTDGRTYTVQYFERAVLEYHPELAGTPYEVLLSLVGGDTYRQKYPAGAPDPRPHPAGRLFPQTGKRLGGSFRTYWDSQGGVPQQGYPISDEFTEVSALDGKPYTVQYFERAVFEYHPEHKGTPYEVLLTQLGTYRYRARYQVAIPPPATGLRQYGPLGSDDYLLWHETPARLSPGGLPLPLPTTESGGQPVTLRGLHLPTGRAVGPIPSLDNLLLAGTILVGTDRRTRQLLALDLTTGTRYPLSPTGGATAHAADGRTVAWVEPDPGHSGTNRILMQTLGGPRAQPVITSTGDILAMALSTDYLAWIDAGSTLRSLDRATGAVRTVSTVDKYYTAAPIVSLVGPVLYCNLLAQDTNLRTGATGQVSPGSGYESIFARPDVVLWMFPHDFWGQRLPAGAPRRLLHTGYNVLRGKVALAGSWLVYEGATDYEGPTGWVTVRLDDLFRTDPLPTGTPGAPPTLPPPTLSPFPPGTPPTAPPR